MNRIVRFILKWVEQTTLAYVAEFFLSILIDTWNLCVDQFHLPFSTIDIEKLTDTKDASTIYDCNDFLNRLIEDDLIDLSTDEVYSQCNPSLQNTEMVIKDLFDTAPILVFDLVDFRTEEVNNKKELALSTSECLHEMRSHLYSNIYSKDLSEIILDNDKQIIEKTEGKQEKEEDRRHDTVEGDKYFREMLEIFGSETEKINSSNEPKYTLKPTENELLHVFCKTSGYDVENTPEVCKLIQRNNIWEKSEHFGDTFNTLTSVSNNDIQVYGSEFDESEKIDSDVHSNFSVESISKRKIESENIFEKSEHYSDTDDIVSSVSDNDKQVYGSQFRELEKVDGGVPNKFSSGSFGGKVEGENIFDKSENFRDTVDPPTSALDNDIQVCDSEFEESKKVYSEVPNEFSRGNIEGKVDQKVFFGKSHIDNDLKNNESLNIILEVNANKTDDNKNGITLQNVEIQENVECQSSEEKNDENLKCEILNSKCGFKTPQRNEALEGTDNLNTEILENQQQNKLEFENHVETVFSQDTKYTSRYSNSHCLEAINNSEIKYENVDLETSEDSSDSDEQKCTQDTSCNRSLLLIENNSNSSEEFFSGNTDVDETSETEELIPEIHKESPPNCFDAQADPVPYMNLNDIQNEFHDESSENSEVVGDENTDSEWDGQNIDNKEHTQVAPKDISEEESSKEDTDFKFGPPDLRINESEENLTLRGTNPIKVKSRNDCKGLKPILKTKPANETKTVHFNSEIDTLIFEPNASIIETSKSLSINTILKVTDIQSGSLESYPADTSIMEKKEIIEDVHVEGWGEPSHSSESSSSLSDTSTDRDTDNTRGSEEYFNLSQLQLDGNVTLVGEDDVTKQPQIDAELETESTDAQKILSQNWKKNPLNRFRSMIGKKFQKITRKKK